MNFTRADNVKCCIILCLLWILKPWVTCDICCSDVLTGVQDNPTISVANLLFTFNGRHPGCLLLRFQKYLWNKHVLIRLRMRIRREIVLLFCDHMASFTLAHAALLNKSEWLASVLSHTSLCSSPSPPPPPPLSPSHAHSQKRQTPTVDSAHVRGLIRIVVPWWWGTVRPAWGVCRHEACQRAFKEPRPRKRKQMAAGITLPTDCTCFPPPACVHPSLSSYSTSVQKSLWGLWSGRMSQCWACPHSIRSQGPCWLLHNPFQWHTFTNRQSQLKFMACSAPLLPSTRLTTNKNKLQMEQQQEH